MKKRIMMLILMLLSIITLASCTERNEFEVIYDKHDTAIAINDFNLSDIILYKSSDGTIIFVTEEMLNAEDLNKTKIPGNHIIKINFNNQIYECEINLVNFITYEIKNTKKQG